MADLRLEGQEDGIAMIFPLSHLLSTKSKGGGGQWVGLLCEWGRGMAPRPPHSYATGGSRYQEANGIKYQQWTNGMPFRARHQLHLNEHFSL